MPSKTQLRAALASAETQCQDLCFRLLVTTLVAHERAGHIPLEHAAAACHMTPNNFRVAGQQVDLEAKRMLANTVAQATCAQCKQPNGATLFGSGPYFCSRDCMEEYKAGQKEDLAG